MSTPAEQREGEGLTAAAQDARIPLFGVLASQSGFTLASMQHAVRSRVPLLLLHLEGGRPQPRGVDIEEGEEPGDDTGTLGVEGERVDGEGEKGRGKEGKEGGQPQIQVTGAWWNRAFGSLLAECGVEIRREIAGSHGSTRVGVWTAGVRMGRYGPPL